jgi:hypothetical protein
MTKRIIVSILGVLAIFAGLMGLGYASEGIGDFKNPQVALHEVVLGEILMSVMMLAAFGLGIRFLDFGFTGRNVQSNSWVRPILLGIGFFFPGFVFSFPLTMLWAIHTWPGDNQNDIVAFKVSFCIGIAAAISCCIVLLRHRHARHT